jgi:hypothetical protein
MLWMTDSDTFVPGQWFKGRIYERRGDLSPSGQRLIYFAAKFKGPYYSWTAVSRPPSLTAIALWPKTDTWGGGGLFASENEILLNHAGVDLKLAEGYRLPDDVRVTPLWEGGEGEDEPILARKLVRDGWTRRRRGKSIMQSDRALLSFRFDPPEIWTKAHPGEYPGELRMIMLGHGERGGPWDVTEHTLVAIIDQQEIPLGRTDWADWDHSGDLVFAKDGQLFRLGFDKGGSLRPVETATSLIDMTRFAFTEVSSPLEARKW